jgi:phosphomannomutase
MTTISLKDELIAYKNNAAMETSEVTIEISDTEKFQVITTLSENASGEFPNNSSMLDGVSLEFENKWGVIRASNTTPCLVGRFEGVTLQDLVDIKETFNRLLKNVNVQIAL